MAHHFHAVVWMDHRDAHIYEFNPEDVQKFSVHSHKAKHLHHKAGVLGSGHAAEDTQYFQDIAHVLEGPQEVLVTGPGGAKTQFVKWAVKHAHAVSDKVKGVETSDHPTDGQIVAHARAYFGAFDRTQPQR